MKIIVYKLSTIFVSLIFIILFTEISVRIFVNDGFNYELEMMKYAQRVKRIEKVEDQKIFLHKPNVDTTIMRARVKTDSNGFRYDKKQKNNLKKIMLLGDSMTFGFGSSYTFADFLQENLSNEYNILNTGVGNTNTVMQEKGFFKFHKKHEPKILVLNFVINDLESIVPKNKNFIRNNFYSYTYINYKLTLLNFKLTGQHSYIDYYKQQYKNKKQMSEVFNSILKLKSYSNKNDIKFFIHFLPELRGLQDYKFIDEVNILKEFLNSNSIEYIDGLKFFKDLKEEDLWVSHLDPHANEKAHKIIGKYLFEFLKKEIFK